MLQGKKIEVDKFIGLSTKEMCEVLKRERSPRLGVFVPDGSRRLVLAFTDAVPGSEEFFRLCAVLPAKHLLESLKVFFDHGLPTLLVPIMSRSVFNRGEDYRRFTALDGLKILFKDPNWRKFYAQYDIRVCVYGDPEMLRGTVCEPVLAWMRETLEQTIAYQTHTLYYAIGESPRMGENIAAAGIAFYQQYGRPPTTEEQIRQYYGEPLPPADFFIMSSKMSGLGALPRFLVDGDTEVYFFPVPGMLGLTEETYRLILQDLLFHRSGLRAEKPGASGTVAHRAAMKEYYTRNVKTVLGLGRQIGSVWVPEDGTENEC